MASMAALAPTAQAQQGDTAVTFRIFLRGSPIGSEDVSVQRSANGWTISGTGHLGAPLDLTTRRLEVRYDANWKPQELTIDANTKGATFAIHTTFANGQAESEINQTGVVKRKTDAVSADTVVLPNLFFGTYEALALRLASIPVGSTFHAYVAPQAEIVVKETASSSQRIETAKRVVVVKTYALTFQNPGAPLDATLWTDEAGRLVRFEVPAQSLLVARDDFASVSARALVMSRAGDQPVTIAANGFNLAGTLSQPSGSGDEGTLSGDPDDRRIRADGPRRDGGRHSDLRADCRRFRRRRLLRPSLRQARRREERRARGRGVDRRLHRRRHGRAAVPARAEGRGRQAPRGVRPQRGRLGCPGGRRQRR